MSKYKSAALKVYKTAHIVKGSGTNPPDIAVRKGRSGLLSKLCFNEEDAWKDAQEAIQATKGKP